MGSSGGVRVPARLALLVTRDQVLLPGSTLRVSVDSPRDMQLVARRLLDGTSLKSSVIGVIPETRTRTRDRDRETRTRDRDQETRDPETRDRDRETRDRDRDRETRTRDRDHEDLPYLHRIGTAGLVVQVGDTNWPRPHYSLLIWGLCRFRVSRVLQEKPFVLVEVEQLEGFRAPPGPPGTPPGSPPGSPPGPPGTPGTPREDRELEELSHRLYQAAVQLLDMLDVSVPMVTKLRRLLDEVPRETLPDVVAAMIQTSPEEKLQVLDAVSLPERFRRTLPMLTRQIRGLLLLQRTRRNPDAARRRPRGGGASPGRPSPSPPSSLEDREEEEEEEEDGDALERKVHGSNMPEAALRVCVKELKRLKKMPQSMPEYALTRNYLELMVELPWSKNTTDCLDVGVARAVLDGDHYAMQKLKRRVLEYLAVRRLQPALKGPILCFVGPPGVGKTSVGRSIARTLGRQFHRIALGGVCDQSDIRGHRRTYVGSLPGRIINGLKTAGVNNPVFLLDEVDKLGRSLQGDPAAALLEVLDPEQNHNFTDHYLNVPFDLSQVLFIATANSTTSIPPALLDRMELLHVPGYTQEEKVEISHRHLIPKQLEQHGLTDQQLLVPMETTQTIISSYTREAGVRSLERKFAAICRAVAVKVAERKPTGQEDSACPPASPPPASSACPPASSAWPIVVDGSALRDILGPPLFEADAVELTAPGVALGLAWTAHGGELMLVEASRTDGDGQLVLTGQLGDVMKESARLAVSWLRANAHKYRLTSLSGSADPLDATDIHLHFPAGAVTKDGPSAGVTMVTCLASLLSGRPVRSDVAMTGEITLRGLVLPVGGVKEKVLAAYRAGVKHVVLPRRNLKDLDELPENVLNELVFIDVHHLEDVLNAAFTGGLTGGHAGGHAGGHTGGHAGGHAAGTHTHSLSSKL